MARVDCLRGVGMFATEAFENRHEPLVDLVEAGLIAGAAQGIVVVVEDAIGAGRQAVAGFDQGRTGRLRLVNRGGLGAEACGRGRLSPREGR